MIHADVVKFRQRPRRSQEQCTADHVQQLTHSLMGVRCSLLLDIGDASGNKWLAAFLAYSFLNQFATPGRPILSAVIISEVMLHSPLVYMCV